MKDLAGLPTAQRFAVWSAAIWPSIHGVNAMSKITVAQLAEQMSALSEQVGILANVVVNQQQSTTATEQPKVAGEAGSLTALRAGNKDSFESFPKVFKARLRKALPYAKDNGPICLWYIWSPTKNRSYVNPMKQSTKCRNGTLLATVMPDGSITPAVKGLDLTTD